MEITVPAAPRPAGQRRGGGSTNIIKAFLYMLRWKSPRGKKARSLNSIPLDVAADGKWQRLLGSMRLMHVQAGGLSPPPPQMRGMSRAVSSDTLEEVFTPPLSPCVDVMWTPGTSASSSIGYDSPAVNLQELRPCEAEETVMEDNEYGGDEMIDAKAEEFIAKFYEQMRLQK